MPKIHPRQKIVAEARASISDAVLKAVEQHQLTYGELTALLAGELSGWAKYQIRDERHPGDPDMPGGLAAE